jgi:hypothetical protein
MIDTLHLDHVLLGVRDLAAAIARMREQHGLIALPGGLLAGGLRNAIVPLRDGQYLELIAVDGSPRRPTSAQHWIIDATESRDRLVWFAVRAADLDAVAQRTGRRIMHNVAREEGGPMQGGWRSIWPAGGALSGLPFFIDYVIPWDSQKAVRDADYDRSASPAQPGTITGIDVSCSDAKSLWSWLDLAPESLPIRTLAGGRHQGVSAVRIASARGEIDIG